jgi:hypothetical protein
MIFDEKIQIVGWSFTCQQKKKHQERLSAATLETLMCLI